MTNGPVRAEMGAEESAELDKARVSESALELLDVPAAVVCAHCGDPDCGGCLHDDEPTGASGIVAIVPWERPGLGGPQRLWSTAKLSTLGAESFFGALPDGEVATALRFAVLAELLSVAGICVVLVPVALAFVPWVFELLSRDAWFRELVARALMVGVPGLALVMVGVHAVHGISLDLGARRIGARPKPVRGLRFGLYSCGWDLVTLPAGLAMLAITNGFREARRAAPLSLTVPRRATLAFLRGVYRLDDTGAQHASRFAIALTGGLIVLGSLVAVAGLVALSLR